MGEGAPSWFRIASPYPPVWKRYNILTIYDYPGVSCLSTRPALSQVPCSQLQRCGETAYESLPRSEPMHVGDGRASELSARGDVGVLLKRLSTRWLQKAMSGRAGHSVSSVPIGHGHWLGYPGDSCSLRVAVPGKGLLSRRGIRFLCFLVFCLAYSHH